MQKGRSYRKLRRRLKWTIPRAIRDGRDDPQSYLDVNPNMNGP